MKKKPDMMQARREFYEKITSNSMTLSQTIKSMRKLIGKTQIEFANFVGIGVRILRSIEQEKGNPTLETLQKIAGPFGLQIAFVKQKGS